MARRVYLDHNATAPLHPQVLAAMLPALERMPGNPSSIHWAGQQARQAVDRARRQVAELLGARPAEIVFCSGGTEADNLALRGVMAAAGPDRSHLITSAVEHPAVLSTCQDLEQHAVQVTYLPVDAQGRVDPAAAAAAIRDDTALISVMLANNDVGTLQPVADIARLARERGVPVHTDAVQAVGRVPVDVARLGVSLLSLSGHKLGGPKGVGALWIAPGVALWPQLTGGSHERGRRAGTENVAGIVGLGAACQLARDEGLEAHGGRVRGLLEELERQLLRRLPGAVVHGQPRQGLPNTLNLRLPGVDGEAALMNLDLLGVAVSAGSACSSGSLEPSHVLTAMGLTSEQASQAIRISLGHGTTGEELQLALDALVQVATSMGFGAEPA